MLSIDFVASVPKELGHPELNEDCFFADEETGHFALSDGASESYDSQTWARLLTSRYVAAPEFTPDWVESAVDLYRDRFDFDSLSWSQQAAFDRGSFATLLTLACRSDSNELDVFSIGDCLAVHCVEGRISDSFPFTQPEQFDARPELLSTRGEANAFVGQPLFYKNHTATWPFIPGAKVLLLTDALGQCLLRDMKSSGRMLRALLEVQELNEFERLVLALRATYAIRLDDTTLVRLTVGAKVV